INWKRKEFTTSDDWRQMSALPLSSRQIDDGTKCPRACQTRGVWLHRRVAINVQRLRRDRGLSQEELAHRSRIHQTYLSGVEHGSSAADVEVTRRLRLLGIGRDVKARLPLDLVGEFARALDHDDASQSWPVVAFLQPRHIMDGGVGLMAADLGIFEAVRLLLGGEEIDVLAKGAVVALEREDVIGLLIEDLLGNLALTAHRVDGHDGAL